MHLTPLQHSKYGLGVVWLFFLFWLQLLTGAAIIEIYGSCTPLGTSQVSLELMHSSWRTAGLHWDRCLEGPISKSKMLLEGILSKRCHLPQCYRNTIPFVPAA